MKWKRARRDDFYKKSIVHMSVVDNIGMNKQTKKPPKKPLIKIDTVLDTEVIPG